MTRERLIFYLTAVVLARGQIMSPAEQTQGATESLRQGQYVQAEKQFRGALAACDPSQCPELPAILNGLGGLYYEVGRYREAEPLLVRAVKMLQYAQSDDALMTAALTNLAAVYRVDGRLADAKLLYQQAWILQARNGSSLKGSILLAREALLAQDMGDLPGAADLIQRALEGFVTSDATESAEHATALAAWASILESQGNPGRAEEELKHSLEIRERLSGPNDMLVGDALNTLGVSYSHRQRWKDAERALRRAVEIARRYPPSPVLAASMNNLGSALRAQDRGKEAETWIRQAISTWERLLGPDHPNVATSLTNLAVSLQTRGRYAEAARFMERAWGIDERNFPAGHSRIGIDLSRAGALAKSRKHYREAEDLLRRADAILEGALPSTDQEIAAVLLNLADVLRLEKKFEPSGEMYQRGLSVAVSAWGAEDPRLVPWLDGYVSVLRGQQEFAEAARLEAQATRIRVTQVLRGRNINI